MKIAIIGAGITGLTAAFYLKQAGYDVKVFEKNHVGGLIKTKEVDSYLLELGPNVFVLKPEFKQLLHDLNLDDQIANPLIKDYQQLIFRKKDQRGIQAMPKGLFKLIFSKLFSVAEKLLIISGLFKKVIVTEPDLSVLDFFAKFFPSSVVLDVLDPVLRGIYGGSVSKLSAAALFPGLYQQSRSGIRLISYLFKNAKRKQIFVFKNGNATLITRLVEVLGPEILERKEICKIKKNQNSFYLSTDSEELCFDSVIFATPASSAMNLFEGDLNQFQKHKLNLEILPLSVYHFSASKLNFSYSNAFGILFPSCLNLATMGVMFNSNLFAGRAPVDHVLCTVCAQVNRSEVDFSDLLLENQIRSELNNFGIQLNKLLSVQHWDAAIPQYHLMHLDYVKELHEISQQVPNLFFCGADLGGVGVADRIANAKALVANIIGMKNEKSN